MELGRKWIITFYIIEVTASPIVENIDEAVTPETEVAPGPTVEDNNEAITPETEVIPSPVGTENEGIEDPSYVDIISSIIANIFNSMITYLANIILYLSGSHILSTDAETAVPATDMNQRERITPVANPGDEHKAATDLPTSTVNNI